MDDSDSRATDRKTDENMLKGPSKAKNSISWFIHLRAYLLTKRPDSLWLVKDRFSFFNGDFMLDEVLGAITQIPFKGKVGLAFNPIYEPLNKLKSRHSELHYITLLFTMLRVYWLAGECAGVVKLGVCSQMPKFRGTSRLSSQVKLFYETGS